jgi:hypothetical protein
MGDLMNWSCTQQIEQVSRATKKGSFQFLCFILFMAQSVLCTCPMRAGGGAEEGAEDVILDGLS